MRKAIFLSVIKRLLVLFTFLIFLFAQTAYSIDLGTPNSAVSQDADPMVLTYNNSSSHDYLVVGLYLESGSAKTINGCTYNLTPVLRLDMTEVVNDSQGNLEAYGLYRFASPASGLIVMSCDVSAATSDDMIWAMSFDGVSGVGTSGSQKGNTSSPSVTITTTTANSVLVMFWAWEDDEAISENGSENWVQQINTNAGTGDRGQVYTLQTTTAGNYNFDTTTPGAHDYLFGWIELEPDAAPAAIKRRVIID